MVKKGEKFESTTQRFISILFKKFDFQVLSVRKQWSGTQYGFDVLIQFLDDSNLGKVFCIKCKDYSNEVEWKELINKILQVDSSPYDPTGFIAISPKANISNVNHQMLENLQNKVKFPIELWSPDSEVKKVFAIDDESYKDIYGGKPDFLINVDDEVLKVKDRILYLMNKKTLLNCVKKITINDASKEPAEDKKFKTNLDEKLDVYCSFSPKWYYARVYCRWWPASQEGC